MQPQTTANSGTDATAATPRRLTVADARRRIATATNLLQAPPRRDPTLLSVRRAHLALAQATEALEQHIARAALQDADANRRAAIKVAKHTRDARGRKRAPCTMHGYNLGRPNPTRGRTYPPTPPSINDVLRMLALAPSLRYTNRGPCDVCGVGPRQRHTNDCINIYAERLKAAILLLWRGGFRVGCELLALHEHDLNPEHSSIRVARGKNGKPRDVTIDDWVWPMLDPWLAYRSTLPAGPLFCVIEQPTAGRVWSVSNLRRQLHQLAAHAEIRTRVAPHQLRHAWAVEAVLEGIPELYVSRQLGHADLAITSTYLQGLPQSRIRQALRSRPMPQISMMEALKNEGVKLDRRGAPATPLPLAA